MLATGTALRRQSGAATSRQLCLAELKTISHLCSLATWALAASRSGASRLPGAFVLTTPISALRKKSSWLPSLVQVCRTAPSLSASGGCTPIQTCRHHTSTTDVECKSSVQGGQGGKAGSQRGGPAWGTPGGAHWRHQLRRRQGRRVGCIYENHLQICRPCAVHGALRMHCTECIDIAACALALQPVRHGMPRYFLAYTPAGGVTTSL